jgi:hypothetical protein
MIGLRPIRSDSEPKKMKKGVARARPIASMMLAGAASIFRVWVR